jgi:hypothetical protein
MIDILLNERAGRERRIKMGIIFYIMVVYLIFYSACFLDRLGGVFVLNLKLSETDGTGILKRLVSALSSSFSDEKNLNMLAFLSGMIVACMVVSSTSDPYILFFPSLILMALSFAFFVAMMLLHGYEEIDELEKNHPLTHRGLAVLFISALFMFFYSVMSITLAGILLFIRSVKSPSP